MNLWARHGGCILAGILLALAYPTASSAETASRFDSPYQDQARSLEFFDAVVRRVEFALNYAKCSAEADSGLGLRSAEARICLQRPRLKPGTSDGSTQTLRLTLALFPRLQGGYELFAAGDILGTPQTNPDLATVQAQIAALTADIRAVGDAGDDYLVYPLSYIQTDRAIATLKSLGYPVIEFEGANSTAAARDAIFSEKPNEGPRRRRPLIINMVDSERTTLVPSGNDPTSGSGGAVSQGADAINLGGQQLDDVTAGVPQQRLMIVWDTREPKDLHELLDHLRLRIDVPARQILIEAQVIELDVDYLRELGIEFGGSKDGNTWSFQQSTEGLDQPFTYTFKRPSIKSLLNLNVTLSALEDDGNARVLSRPSVLVLDGRQARIQVGSKIPFTSDVTVTGDVANFTNKYLNVGIALNLRPRANQDGSEVTMQVETLISSAGASEVVAETNTLIAPPILSREVQSLVRVANDTPFIIGGLISASRNENDAGVPGLRKIPWLGRLFSRQDVTRQRTEVIVVITPHVIPIEDDAFSYTIPKDSDLFDSFDTELFRNIYRVRHQDLLDFAFITESAFFQDIALAVWEDARRQVTADLEVSSPQSEEEGTASFRLLSSVNVKDRRDLARGLRELSTLANGPANPHPCKKTSCSEAYLTFLEGRIPGEDILVKRMLLRLVQNLKLASYVPLERVSYFIHPHSPAFEQGEGDTVSEMRRMLSEAPPRASGSVADPILQLRTDLARRLEALDPPCRAGGCQPDSVCRTLSLAYRNETLPRTGNVSDATRAHLQQLSDSKAPDSNHLSFDPPRALVTEFPVESSTYLQHLRSLNAPGGPGARRWATSTLLLNHCFGASDLGDRHAIERLRQVLVLERVLDLNPSLPLTLDGFHVGREIVFPTPEDLADVRYLIDRQTAELFYENVDYYYAFEQVFRDAVLTDDVQEALRLDQRAVTPSPPPTPRPETPKPTN